MENNDECIYFLYPENFSMKSVKSVFQDGYLNSIGVPSLMQHPYVQTYTEEDVKNFGIENLCRKVMDSKFSTCTVLRIPKSYLGLDANSDKDCPPIFLRIPATSGNHRVCYVRNGSHLQPRYTLPTGFLQAFQ